MIGSRKHTSVKCWKKGATNERNNWDSGFYGTVHLTSRSLLEKEKDFTGMGEVLFLRGKYSKVKNRNVRRKSK